MSAAGLRAACAACHTACGGATSLLAGRVRYGVDDPRTVERGGAGRGLILAQVCVPRARRRRRRRRLRLGARATRAAPGGYAGYAGYAGRARRAEDAEDGPGCHGLAGLLAAAIRKACKHACKRGHAIAGRAGRETASPGGGQPAGQPPRPSIKGRRVSQITEPRRGDIGRDSPARHSRQGSVCMPRLTPAGRQAGSVGPAGRSGYMTVAGRLLGLAAPPGPASAYK